MSYLILLDVAKAQQAERIRQVERDRAFVEAREAARRNGKRRPVLKSLLLALGRS